jgi:hypothetical protein
MGPDAIALQNTAAAHGDKKQQLDDKPDIEYAEQGGTDIPAVVDIHGDVIKADWHAIRAKANDAEEYEHSLGIWQSMKTYKKVRLLLSP